MHSFLFELSEVSGADITATITFVPRPPRTVGHLKLIMKEEREGGVLEERERNRKPGFRLLSGGMNGSKIKYGEKRRGEMIGVLNKS